MGVNVSSQQQNLEHQHARRPDRSGTTEPGQNGFADDQLHLEQQECAQERGSCEEQRNNPSELWFQIALCDLG
jgi:hypothetical protein